MTFCFHYLSGFGRHEKGECAFCDFEVYGIPLGQGSLNGSFGLKTINFQGMGGKR